MFRSPFVIAGAFCTLLLPGCSDESPFALGEPVRLVISVQPQDARVGVPLGVQPVIEVRDGGNNLVSDTILVTASLASGGGDLLGTLTVPAVDGVARFTDLRMHGAYGPKALGFASPGMPPVTADSIVLNPPPRSVADRPDDLVGTQVHVIYVLPRDGVDRQLDTKLDIANSLAVAQAWLSRVAGLQVRFDLFEGVLDVTFFELSRSEDELRHSGIRREIESQLAGAGLIRHDKRYLVYYDGDANYDPDGVGPCGGAAWPPLVPGQVAALYLRTCGGHFATHPTAAPGYWEFAALHDLFHTLGIVSAAAPHANRSAHVPEPEDLMCCSGGVVGWRPSIVDVNNDDYFGPNLPDTLVNLATSPYVKRVAAAATTASLPARTLEAISLMPPPHQPFTQK